MKLYPVTWSLVCLSIVGIAGSAVADPAAEAAASKTYAAKCASCHGKDGKGNSTMAKVFKVEPAALDMTKKETLDKTDADLEKIVSSGLNKMPAYKGKISDSDIAAVVAHVRSLSKPADPAK